MQNSSQQRLPLTHSDTPEGRLFAAYDAARQRGMKQPTFSQAMQNQQVAKVLQMAAEATE